MLRQAQLLLPDFSCWEFVVLPDRGPSSSQRDRGGGVVPVEQLCGKDEVIVVLAALISCG